ncbi:MAG: hypothetical protein H7311_01270 [Ramlibacter sp.]|nr:hypothetical protein [Cryobacterium sp.]
MELERRELFTLALPHADAGRIEAELRQRGVPYDDAARLAAIVAHVTGGGAELKARGHEWVDVER